MNLQAIGRGFIVNAVTGFTMLVLAAGIILAAPVSVAKLQHLAIFSVAVAALLYVCHTLAVGRRRVRQRWLVELALAITDEERRKNMHLDHDTQEALKARIVEFTCHVVGGASEARKRRGEDDRVSTADVESAVRRLYREPSRSSTRRMLQTVGGVLLGAGVAEVIAVLSTGTFSKQRFIVVLGLTCVGVVLTAMAIVGDD